MLSGSINMSTVQSLAVCLRNMHIQELQVVITSMEFGHVRKACRAVVQL